MLSMCRCDNEWTRNHNAQLEFKGEEVVFSQYVELLELPEACRRRGGRTDLPHFTALLWVPAPPRGFKAVRCIGADRAWRSRIFI